MMTSKDSDKAASKGLATKSSREAESRWDNSELFTSCGWEDAVFVEESLNLFLVEAINLCLWTSFFNFSDAD